MQRLQQFWNAHQEPQIPLEFLIGPNVWKAGIGRDSIINAIGNIKTTESLSRKANQAGRQNSAQAKKTTALHRAQVQRLAALANAHAQLCYDFENRELLIQNLSWTDPTCRRALKGCSTEIFSLHLPSSAVDPSSATSTVRSIICKWYSPGFTCSELEFHTWIWTNVHL
jgi:hypothetical protein